MKPIDGEQLEEIIYKFYCKGCIEERHDRCRGCKVTNILGFMKKLCDKVEAKPIVHAHWNADGRCTNCGGHAPFFAYADDWFETKYCPHCGAQMDKFASDNNVGSKGVKIPVISMEDVPKLAKEMEK